MDVNPHPLAAGGSMDPPTPTMRKVTEQPGLEVAPIGGLIPVRKDFARKGSDAPIPVFQELGFDNGDSNKPDIQIAAAVGSIYGLCQ